ncbi:hypothetical protein [Arthrobacter sp. NPDC057009]|uniref:hypothetical protein n=1 Tax=Arthrobacter sp. NPDC057009 TaxID=3345996 RepID=UPI0036275AC0
MQSTELEMRVLSAIDAIHAHRAGEDDLVEFKAEWPAAVKEKFVRQLAGSLNRAAGEPVILIIGIDEKTGKHRPWTALEMSNWWPSVQSHFDQAMPELLRDRTIEVEGGKVRALAISSERAPYVLKLANGSSSREIPIREGTGTRSAARDEILRMFVPAVQIPNVDVLRIGVTWTEMYPDPNPDSDFNGGMYFKGYADIFVEHTFNRPSVMLPRHRISGEISPIAETVHLTSPSRGIPEQTLGLGHAGVVEREDGFIVNGPGTLRVRFQSNFVDWESNKHLLDSEFLNLSIDLPVSGTNRSVHVEQMLRRNDEAIKYSGNGTEDPTAHWSYAF